MRKRYRVLVFAVLVAALVAPVGLALSLGSSPSIGQTPSIAQTPHPLAAPFAAGVVTAPLILQVRDAASASVPQQGFDAAGLLMVGTVLFGLAAVIRKAI
jgi:hypothetical protein